MHQVTISSDLISPDTGEIIARAGTYEWESNECSTPHQIAEMIKDNIARSLTGDYPVLSLQPALPENGCKPEMLWDMTPIELL